MEASVDGRRTGQEGSRWINQRPPGEEVANWFEENVTLHDESLDHGHYVQGITLIVQTVKENEVIGFSDKGVPTIDERTNLHYVPYAKVETRVKYFWDVVAALDAVGFIEPVAPPKPAGNLPEGFYAMAVTTTDGKIAQHICATMRATVYERGTIDYEQIVNRRTGEITTVRTGKVLMQGAPASKQVPVLGRFGSDANALMKAETGAVGRALGMLGMLVVPGSGVATAEDMLEAQGQEGVQAQAAPAEVKTGEEAVLSDDDDALRAKITTLVGTLGEIDKARLDAFRAFVKDRGISGIKDATSPQLRGLVARLEKDIVEAQQEQREEAREEEPAEG